MARTATVEQLRLDPDQRALRDATFVVLDLETTGLRPEDDRITEVGAVKVRGGRQLAEFQTLVRPDVELPAAISAITGITPGMVAEAPPIRTVLPMLLEFLDGAVLVAHNARFDTSFLDCALARHGYPRLACDVVDTARLARRLVPNETRDLRLATLARFFRSPTTPNHRALADARATVHVLHGLLERAGAIGVTTVEDLLDQQRSRSQPAFRKRSLADGAPDAPGVYRFHDREGRVLYVGTASRLRQRLRRYFGQDDRSTIATMVREAADVSWDTTATAVEAQVRELRELAERRPRFNRRSTRPPVPVWLRLTDEPFPRLLVSRTPGDGDAAGLGPLPGRRVGTALAEAVQEVAAVRTSTHRIRVAQDHAPCIRKQLGRCVAPCDGTIGRDAYHRAIADVQALLAGDPTGLLATLRARMDAFAATERFEEAARVRGRLHDLARHVDDVRALRATAPLARLEVARRVRGRIEGVRLRHGLLVASASVDGSRGWRDIVEALAAVPDEVPGHTTLDPVGRAEAVLLARWVRAPGTVLLDADGDWAEPCAGGAITSSVAAEAGAVARSARQDRQVLGGRKVRRTGEPTQTSSNQLDQASGGDTAGPGSRPSHDARTR